MTGNSNAIDPREQAARMSMDAATVRRDIIRIQHSDGRAQGSVIHP